jgi:hypothetical protein
LAIFGVTSQTLSSKGDTEDRDEANHAVTLALGKMSDDLNMAFIVKSKDFLGATFDGDIPFVGSEDRVDFVSFSHSRYLKDSKEGDSAEFSYFLAPDPDEPTQRVLMRREATQIDKNLQEGGIALPLLEKVDGLHFEYYDEKSKDWKKTWDTRSVDFGDKLPAQIKIQIDMTIPGEEEKKTFTTIVPIQLRKGSIIF